MPRTLIRHRVPVLLLTALLLLLLVPILVPIASTGVAGADDVTTPAPAPSPRPVVLDGGGVQNVVAVDPTGTGVVLAGGDVSGFHRSTDWGRTWTPANTGVDTGGLAVASILFAPSNPGRVYAAVGKHGAGGLLVSDDSGASWTTHSTEPRFSGVHGPTVRPTGNLLAMDATRDLLYAGTLDQGVLRSGDQGRTWTALPLPGDAGDIRSLALDPGDLDVLYVATWQGPVYRTEAAAGDGQFDALAKGPSAVEELLVANGDLWAAGWTGIHRSENRGRTWSTVRDDGALWLSLAAAGPEGEAIVYAGGGYGKTTRNGSAHLIRTADDGRTWQAPTVERGAVRTEVGGPGGVEWWIAADQPQMMLAGRQAFVSHLAVSSTDRVFTAGRLGVWATADAGSTWYPMVDGLGDTVVPQVTVDPRVDGRVYAGLADWVLATSEDGGASFDHTRPPTGTNARAVALDPTATATTSPVYAGVGHNTSNIHGEVWSNPDPTKSVWVDEGLSDVTKGQRPVALAVQTIDGEPVILAALQGGGVWRKAAGAWTLVNPRAFARQTANLGGSIAWAPNGSTVYLYDPAEGVWRSDDAGRTWWPLWAKPSWQDLTGRLVVHPDHPDDVFVSVGNDGVYQLRGATSGTIGAGVTPVRLGDIDRPGPIAVGPDGDLYVAEVAASEPALWRSDDAGKNWIRVDDEAYRSVAHFPSSVAVDHEVVYVALRGNGVIAQPVAEG